MNLQSLKIVSGGQTGADRTGLDWAIKHGIPHGGWCPKAIDAGGDKIKLRALDDPDLEPIWKGIGNV